MERSRKGDLEAFNLLVEAYQGQVYALCVRMLGSREAGEDAAQDAFLSAFRGIGRYRGGSFRAWLLRIAANACYDALRRRQRRPAGSLDALLDDPDGPLTLTDPGETPEEHALRRELARELEAALADLPPEERLAVLLCDVQGLAYHEIGQALGVPLGTVKSRIARGRARLRERLSSRPELLRGLRRQEG
ncbi:MAG TPA: sigma-70 family RNA polymerase sigma factor [Dehalococcoidia bacterium]